MVPLLDVGHAFDKLGRSQWDSHESNSQKKKKQFEGRCIKQIAKSYPTESLPLPYPT